MCDSVVAICNRGTATHDSVRRKAYSEAEVAFLNPILFRDVSFLRELPNPGVRVAARQRFTLSHVLALSTDPPHAILQTPA